MEPQRNNSLQRVGGAHAHGVLSAGGAVSANFAALMALTSDAVVAFDGTGSILFANPQVTQLTGFVAEDLVGRDISELIFDSGHDIQDVPTFTSLSELLSLICDGSMKVLSARLANGGATMVSLRGDRVSAPGETYLVALRPFEPPTEVEHDHDRLVDELALANRRLSGTLRIVLDTIDVGDVETLFSTVLEQLAVTLEASGAVLYLVDNRGYQLHATTKTLASRNIAKHLDFNERLVNVLAKKGVSLRLRLAAPAEQSLRSGRLAKRTLIDEETGEEYEISARHIPPFASFICVPVWFADHVIAVIEVGWAEARATRKDDARLMDSVAQYLSTEFAAALSTMRTMRTQRLDQMASKLHHGLESEAHVTKGDLSLVALALARDLRVKIAPIRLSAHGRASVINLPISGAKSLDLDLIGAAPSSAENPLPTEGIEFPFKIEDLVRGKVDQNIAVVPIEPRSPLAIWLAEQGCTSTGVIFDLGVIAGFHRSSLLLRDASEEPIDDEELDFLRRIAIDIHETAAERIERTKDTHISQALQSGMKNELQKVEGIYAEGLYSSATEAALVGGDFYDLIALPNKRACVILGDVSGKGVEAASVSAAVRTALGAYAWEGQTPARMVRLLNDFLLGFSRLETFATLFVGMIDLAHGQLTYCSAGHPPAIFLHADTAEMQTLDEQSGVVGAFKGMTYHDGHVNLAPGDGLVLYTDGVTEARNPAGAFFGETGLHDAVMQEVGAGIEGLTNRLLGHLDTFTERSLEDDVAMVALRFDKVGKAK